MGLPLAAIWLLGKVQSLKFAIQDRARGCCGCFIFHCLDFELTGNG